MAMGYRNLYQDLGPQRDPRSLPTRVHDQPHNGSYLVEVLGIVIAIPYELCCTGANINLMQLRHHQEAVVNCRGKCDPYVFVPRVVEVPDCLKPKPNETKEKSDLCSTHIYTRK